MLHLLHLLQPKSTLQVAQRRVPSSAFVAAKAGTNLPIVFIKKLALLEETRILHWLKQNVALAK